MQILSRTALLGAAALYVALGGTVANAASILYSIDSQSDLLRVIDPTDASTNSSVAITLAGETVEGGTGLAVNPFTNELYGLLRLDGVDYRELVRIDPLTGVATSIGNTGDFFAGLAFDAAGTLYGVTGDGADTPETLFTFSLADATATLFLALGNGDDGEAIAFNPLDGLMYHASGHDSACEDEDFGLCFESIDLSGMTITDIDISATALIDEEAQALTWWDDAGAFLWKQGHFEDGPLFRVTPDGTPTLIGDLDHQAKGLAFVEIAEVPEPGTLAVFAIGLAGLAGLAAARRRKTGCSPADRCDEPARRCKP